MPKCTPGHALQCQLSKKPICTCACKGANHGKFDQWWHDNVDRELLAEASLNATAATKEEST